MRIILGAGDSQYDGKRHREAPVYVGRKEEAMIDFMFDVLQTTGLGTLIFIVLLCCKRAFQKQCCSRFWHYLLMLNTVIFMIPMYPLKRLLAPLAPPVRLWIQDVVHSNFVYNQNTLVDTPPQVAMLGRGLLFIWLVGAVILFAAKTAKHVSFINYNKKKSYAVPTVASDVFLNQVLKDNSLCNTRRVSRAVLFANDNYSSPFSYGFFRKRIILPGVALQQYDENEIFLMLRHESIHIKNHGSWKRLFVLFVHSLNWFNPIYYLFSRIVNESIELYCDEIAISHQNSVELRFQYGELLLSMVANKRNRAVLGQFFANKGFMQQRIQRITTMPRKSKKSIMLLLTALLISVSFVYLVGFTATDYRVVNNYQMNIIDEGEEAEPIELPQPSSGAVHDFSKEGEYVFSGYLRMDTVNYVPISFVTHSSRITLTLLSETEPITVNMYYSIDLDYPLMQFVLAETNTPYTFEALSGQCEYSIGYIVESNVEGIIQVLLSD